MHNNSEARQQMFDLIEQWKQSSLSQKSFCEEHSLRYHTFYYWLKCYRRQHADNNNNSFVKLNIDAPSSSYAAEIYFPNGVRVIFHEPVNSSYLKTMVG